MTVQRGDTTLSPNARTRRQKEMDMSNGSGTGLSLGSLSLVVLCRHVVLWYPGNFLGC